MIAYNIEIKLACKNFCTDKTLIANKVEMKLLEFLYSYISDH